MSLQENVGTKKIIINNTFAYNIAFDIIAKEENHELRSIDKCRCRNDWPKWKDAIQFELDSLANRKVLGPIVQIPKGVKLVRYK